MVEINGQRHPIFQYDVEAPEQNNHIVFEVLGMPTGKNFSVVRIPDNYALSVGRSDSDICVPDISVSRRQSFIKYDVNLGELVLQDDFSRFGTHLLIQRPMKLYPYKPMLILSGLSMIRIEVRRENEFTCKSLFPCFRPENQRKYIEDEQILYDSVKDKMP